MAEVVGTIKGGVLGAGGNLKQVTVSATIGSTSDTITISQAQTGIRSIVGIVGAVITGGLDAAFSYIQVSITGVREITIASFEQDGTVATDFTGTTVDITILGKTGEGV